MIREQQPAAACIDTVLHLRRAACVTVACVVLNAGRGAEFLSSDELGALRTARPGEVLKQENLWQQRRTLPLIPVEIHDAHGPQFLLSDKPEYFPGNGISLQELVQPGVVRLYIYHVPDSSHKPKVISCILENPGTAPLRVKLLRTAFPKPGTDYPRVVKEALAAFLSSRAQTTVRSILPGEAVPLDAAMDATEATAGQLVHGFYEFELDQPCRISVFQRDPDEKSIEVVRTLPKFPGSTGTGAGRGLFKSSEFVVTNKTGSAFSSVCGPQLLIVADGKEDRWIKGQDGISSATTQDAGNYGVMYRIRITRSPDDTNSLAVLMGRSGSAYSGCGKVGGAVAVNDGFFPAGVVVLPKDQIAFGERGEMALIQKFGPVVDRKNATIEITYSPPGAACMPTPLLFVPYWP